MAAHRKLTISMRDRELPSPSKAPLPINQAISGGDNGESASSSCGAISGTSSNSHQQSSSSGFATNFSAGVSSSPHTQHNLTPPSSFGNGYSNPQVGYGQGGCVNQPQQHTITATGILDYHASGRETFYGIVSLTDQTNLHHIYMGTAPARAATTPLGINNQLNNPVLELSDKVNFPEVVKPPGLSNRRSLLLSGLYLSKETVVVSIQPGMTAVTAASHRTRPSELPTQIASLRAEVSLLRNNAPSGGTPCAPVPHSASTTVASPMAAPAPSNKSRARTPVDPEVQVLPIAAGPRNWNSMVEKMEEQEREEFVNNYIDALLLRDFVAHTNAQSKAIRQPAAIFQPNASNSHQTGAKNSHSGNNFTSNPERPERNNPNRSKPVLDRRPGSTFKPRPTSPNPTQTTYAPPQQANSRQATHHGQFPKENCVNAPRHRQRGGYSHREKLKRRKQWLKDHPGEQ
ncbi:hypothetical protein EJ08DRAFT_705697 [Tothia fuscella]|uniref:Uncharacterized protein n=1 Tax=Tothia fuscella TaxID=1048955 RepID=A0A9P4TTL7_9PEZI|nr:hypothetical protein EJ08DRAFT_705697 [Tothia fuscella]